MLRHLGRAFAGVVLGILVGVVITLAAVAFRAVVNEVFLHNFGDVVGWLGLPVVLVPAVALWAALRLSGRSFWIGVAVVLAGTVAGVVVGASIGAMAAPPPSAPWAGGILGAGGGALLTALTVTVLLARRTPFRDSPEFPASTGPDPRDRAAAAALVLATITSACAPPPPAPDEPRTTPAPDPSEVESVVFLLGDPGMARMNEYPVLPRMRQDVERWSRALGSDGRVAMVVLGDIIYPDGLHPAEHERRRVDSLRLSDQIEVISGRGADRLGARGIFVPGNHDWGREEDWDGAVRLVRLRDFLESWEGAAKGRLTLAPEPGTGGPAVIDVGDGLRLILLDTAWWLLGSDPEEKDAVIEDVRRALRSAGDRRVMMAAHHPLESGGPHGTAVGLGRTFGIRALLKKAGLLLQDLESRPYADLGRRLLNAFAEAGHPDLYVGGHEHSIQVFASWEVETARSLVVGSSSKLTGVRGAPEMLFGRSEPGYGKIFVLDDGTLHIRLTAAPARFLACGGEEGGEVAVDRAEEARDSVRGARLDLPGPGSCLEEGVEAFRTVWAEDLGPA